ncbi:hypothetical protein SARC_04284 [Sphaeroforma arctica JP610]|uniref:Right handed beta helix domain-containing protein n=1 Tax=Sphaeroforma arctica JP610 TaxID=667725 RepID=A0A0L0G318_9EUKA|nr:hypothetical protein SARC_04284 [Sphaeroforma arctica JP610]KNC83475.1 hypothetical protein SARC_04284 [Sphaeroforma arctica JP610]|eukprot:XP_014157377.1 hypothetical protein SARC_04284 [Sphaeroforma arctica JP610]
MTPSNIIRAGCLLAVAATTVCAQEAPFCDADCNTTPRVCYNATELTRQVQLGLSDIWIHRSITLEDVLELNPPRDLNIRACNTVEVNCSPNGAFKIGEGAEGTTGDSIFIGGFSIVGCNGGAVKARSSNSITLQGLAITGPATEMSEPASALNSPTVLIDSCSFKGNRLDASVLEMGGGALYIDATNATIVHSEFHNNSANYGGAIFSTQALDVQNSNVTSNNCLKAGCGIYAIGLSVSNSRFSGNNNKGQREADPQTIEEATRGGAIYSELGLMATNIICEDNVAYMGGCWYTNSVTEQVSLTDSNFLRNLAHDSTEGSGLGGGGRSVSSMRIERCTFDSNQASSASIFQADGIVDIIDSDFRHNIGVSASSTLLYTGPVTVTNSNFHNNSAFNSGGGAINSEAAENFVQDSNFTMNIAGGGGGAISARGAVILIRSRFIANRANGGQSEQGFGGAVFADTLVAGETLYFGHNTAGLDGGAIVCRGDINISGAQFEFNSATENGGAISAFYQVALASSSFNGNTATGSGGALFLNDVIMANEVNFTNNDAAANGGAIYSSGIFPSYLVAARLTNNTASFGGGIYSENSKVELYNSIVQDNEAFSKGGALYVQQVVVRNSVIKCNKAIIGGALAITGVVVDLDNTTRITSNNGICSNIYFQSGLACEDGLGDDYCDCAFTAQMLAECGNGAVCDIEATKPFTTDVPCLCPEGWFLNTAGGLCIPCSTCGTSASQASTLNDFMFGTSDIFKHLTMLLTKNTSKRLDRGAANIQQHY